MLIKVKSGLDRSLISGDLLLFDNYEWALYIQPKNTKLMPLFVLLKENSYDLVQDSWFDRERLFIKGGSGNTYEVMKMIPKEKLELREI